MTKMAVHLAGDADEAGAAESGGLSLRAVDSRVTIPKQGARYSGTAITCILGGSANALAQLRASFDAGRALLRPSPLHLSIRLADAPTIDMHVAQTTYGHFTNLRRLPPSQPSTASARTSPHAPTGVSPPQRRPRARGSTALGRAWPSSARTAPFT